MAENPAIWLNIKTIYKIGKLIIHIRTSCSLTVIGPIELVRSANLEVLAFLLLGAVAVGLLTHFLNSSLLGVVGDTAHIETVFDVLHVLAVTVERVSDAVLELHR